MKEAPKRVQPLAIVERYDQAVAYLYPIIQNIPRRHGRYRDKLLDALFAVPGLIYTAAKSNQVSRIYHADAALAELRWLLRFAAAPAQKLITTHQHETASIHLAEVGKMVGAWINAKR
ncbi:diversity-generating retroelement protein Avd [Halomonas sp. hl-4]|uniref:diversity-generating retroelement protein Avd n=1 Tax=Halomonas sp. hl-4 TaxID=1761789 RepID=UPI000BB84139|nr:diversity-generating retroelement protein Avd [Halomonas sp. hl-4]SNY95574.1 hypothetical protein SAMN04488142_0075 [Halomonas sp. hl-4]